MYVILKLDIAFNKYNIDIIILKCSIIRLYKAI